MSAQTEATGVVGDRFEIEARVGSGSMGTVFRAVDRLSGQRVALKVVTSASVSSAARFAREAAVLAQLGHPGVIRYVAHGSTPDGRHYLAMEWLEGRTLEDRIEEGRIPLPDTVALGRRVAEALGEAHKKGIVHRDIKPSNLYLPGGALADVKVLDFGIAHRQVEDVRLTGTGVVVGTPMYMAPEQARGERRVDARADLFSLGCVLYECLTGKPPFYGETAMAVLAKILLEEPRPVRDIVDGLPSGLSDLIDGLLAKERGARPAEAALVAKRLDEIARGLEAAPTAATETRKTGPGRTRESLTGEEQRVVCIVLAGAPPKTKPRPEDAPTESEASGVAITAVTQLPGGGTDLALDMQRAVRTFGARLERLLDGSVVATLGGAAAPTDQAVHAARTALALRELLGEVPMTVCTGRAVVKARLPVGEVIDRGARLLRDSPRGVIRIDSQSSILLEGRFDIGGRDDGLELRGERDLQDAPRTVLGNPTPFVGRDRELGTLIGTFDECVSEPTSRVVMVTGPAGSGKSRLRHEFLRGLRDKADRFELMLGRGETTRAGAPFSLLAPAVRWLAGVSPREPPEEQRRKLRARVGRGITGEPEAQVSAFLGEMVGVPFPDEGSPQLRAARQDPRLMGDQIRDAFLSWLEAECGLGPILIVLDDLQWGDRPSLQLIDAALRNLREAPLMVFGLARPEVNEAFPNLWQERELQTLALGGLTKRAAEKLVGGILGSKLSAEKRAQLIERADGNAFYLEELARAVATGGSTTELPDSVLGMAQARLDALGDEPRVILRAASVFGDVFREAGVRGLLGERRVAGLRDWLAIMVEREVVFPKGTGERAEFVFRHSLLREAAYALLTDEDKKRGHRLAAEWLEESGETQALLLAEHFQKGGEPGRASPWYHKAAFQALEASDLTGVLSCAASAIAAGADGEVYGELAWIQAHALQWQGHDDDALKWSLEGMARLPRGSALWFRAAGDAILSHGRKLQYDEGEAIARDVISLAATFDIDVPHVLGLGTGALYMVFGGRWDTVEALLGRMRAAAPTLASPQIDGWIGMIEGTRAQSRGDAATAMTHFEAALAAFRRTGDARLFSFAAGSLGMALAELGAFERTMPLLREAAESADRLGLIDAHINWATLATSLARCGDLPAASIIAARVLEAIKPLSPAVAAGPAGLAQIVLLMRGEHVAVEESARGLLGRMPEKSTIASLLWVNLARSLATQGRRDEADQAIQKALALIDQAGTPDAEEANLWIGIVELTPAGSPERRERLERALERVRERTGGISDPGLRRSFLERVPDNARLLELGREAGLPLAWAAQS